jgi:hypothetical protein
MLYPQSRDKDFLFTIAANKYSARKISEAVTYARYSFARTPDDQSRMRNTVIEQMHMMTAIREYSKHLPPMDDYSKAPADVHSKIKALLTVTAMFAPRFGPHKSSGAVPLESIIAIGVGRALIINNEQLIQSSLTAQMTLTSSGTWFSNAEPSMSILSNRL